MKKKGGMLKGLKKESPPGKPSGGMPMKGGKMGKKSKSGRTA